MHILVSFANNIIFLFSVTFYFAEDFQLFRHNKEKKRVLDESNTYIVLVN